MADDDTDALLAWTARELADKIAANDPNEDGWVLRVLATRIAARAGQVGDALHLMKDFSRAAEAMAEATRIVAARHLEPGAHETGPETTAEDTVGFLTAAAGGLYALHDWF